MTIDCTKINVKNGTSGAMVTEVQKYLKYYGYYDANIDGSCGNYTVEAIKKFQKANGLVVDGIFGTISCQKSNINGNDISNTTRELKILERAELLFVNLQETIEVGSAKRRMTCIKTHNKSGAIRLFRIYFFTKMTFLR